MDNGKTASIVQEERPQKRPSGGNKRGLTKQFGTLTMVMAFPTFVMLTRTRPEYLL